MKCKYLCCNKNYQHKFDEKSRERFFNTCKFPNPNNNNFILLLRKGVYPYGNMDDWEKFNETSLPEKEYFCSHLSMEDITFILILNLGEYHDLYVQLDTLLLMFKVILYCYLSYLKTLEIYLLKCMRLVL